jgi:alginate O-acetyltransferase complex protein AlgI
MAIGLGKIFGFTLMENFDYPYISRSIQEFWNRWHISLSQWFRDYVFYPLEMGKQSKVRGFLNVLMVFLLCGLWHGAAWVYVIWGAYYGVFLGIERLGLRRLLDKIGAPLGHLYALIVICFGWALFRSDTIQQAFLYWCSMLGLNQVRDNAVSVDLFVNVENVVLLVVAVLSCLPQQIIVDKFKTITHITSHTAYAIKYVATLILLILSLSYVANSTFNPFIYVKF